MNGVSDGSQSTMLINSKIENLTLGPVPTDTTNVVIAKPNDLGITDKLNTLLDEYASEMVRLPSTGSCASSITAKVPREFLQSLYDMLNVNNNGCLQETQTFLQMITSLLSGNNDSFINIPRNFWTQIGRVFNELNINESKINLYASAMRSMSMAISTDAQSLASNNLLLSTLDSVSELDPYEVEGPIDEDFANMYPETILDQPDANEVMTEVMNSVPTTIGESSSSPPTSIIDLTASESSENVQLHDLDDKSTVEGQTYSGLQNLFSIKTLNVPISSLRIVNGNSVSTVVEKEVIIDTEVITVLAVEKVDVSAVDMSKTLLEQDWAVIGNNVFNARMSERGVSRKYYDITKLGEFVSDLKMEGPVLKGAITRREYNLMEARALGDALSTLWKKVVSTKLPTPEHIQMGTAILASGLGAAGGIFGSSGLIKASQVVGSISNGLGQFISTLQPTNGLRPEPRSSIPKNALCVVPSVIEAGKSILEGITMNAQQQRIKMSGIKNAIELGYTIPSNELQNRSKVRRINNVFL